MFVIVKMKLKVMLFSFLISANSYAIEKVILQSQSPEFLDWLAATNPRCSKTLGTFSPITDAHSILLLAELFSDNQTSSDYSVAEVINTVIRPDATIFQTSIDCPKDLHTKTRGKISYRNLDHTERFPFQDNQFDTIIMRKGLCLCKNSKKQDPSTTCGGIKLNTTKCKMFFQEVARTLNKGNPNATAFLQGTFKAKVGENFSTVSFEKEKELEKHIEETLDSLASDFALLKFEMVYIPMTIQTLIFTFGADFNYMRNDDGHLLSESRSLSFETLDETIHLFDGIRISHHHRVN